MSPKEANVEFGVWFGSLTTDAIRRKGDIPTSVMFVTLTFEKSNSRRQLAEGEPPQPRLAQARPYDCRGSFVSLQLRAGSSPLEVARWAGHSPQVMFNHYANVIDELVGQPVLPAAEQIAEARQAVQGMGKHELDKLMDKLLASQTAAVKPMPPGQAQVFILPG